MSKPFNIKMLLFIIGLPIFVLCIFGYYINKVEAEKKVFLHAFVVANIGLMQQKENIEQKNNSILVEFENQIMVTKRNSRIVSYDSTAIAVHRLSNELNDYIEQMKIDLVAYTDGCSLDNAKERVHHPFQVRRKTEYNKTNTWFGTKNGIGDVGKAHDLKKKLEQFRYKLISFISTPNAYKKKEIVKNLAILNLEAPLEFQNKDYSRTWEMFYFYKLPLSAALTELTKWQNNVRSAETTMLTYLFEQISATSFKFDAVTAAIIPKSNFVTSGSNFEAEVFLAAYLTAVKPKIVYGASIDSVTGEVRGGIELTPDKFTSDGRGHISIPTSGTGERTCAGIITMRSPVTGAEIYLPFRTKYTVLPL